MPIYTKNEERINIISHFVGAIFAVVGFILLTIKASYTGNPNKIASAVIYGLSLMEMYFASTIYHSTKNDKVRRITQKFDHLSVNISIVGCNVAFLVGGLQNELGYILTGVVIGLSIISIIFNAINVKKFRALTMTCYIITGWMCIFVIHLLYQAIGDGVYLLAAGGACYMIGLIFYAIHKEYMHSIWHFCCLSGALLHFFAVFFYVL